MTRFVLDLNSLLLDRRRGTDRLAVALFVLAVLAGLARSWDASATCLATALLLRSRRAT